MSSGNRYTIRWNYLLENSIVMWLLELTEVFNDLGGIEEGLFKNELSEEWGVPEKFGWKKVMGAHIFGKNIGNYVQYYLDFLFGANRWRSVPFYPLNFI